MFENFTYSVIMCIIILMMQVQHLLTAMADPPNLLFIWNGSVNRKSDEAHPAATREIRVYFKAQKCKHLHMIKFKNKKGYEHEGISNVY